MMHDSTITTREFLGVLLAGIGVAARARQDPAAPAPPTPSRYLRTIVLVRHAERGSDPGDDPPLSAAGEARAARLATMLAPAGVTHVITTQFRRTRDTADPVAKHATLTPRVIEAADVEALLQALAALPQDAVALVVGHSNTVPRLLAKLAPAAAKTAIADDEFGRLFIVTQWGSGPAAIALELRY